jgi:hypothetical protein
MHALFLLNERNKNLFKSECYFPSASNSEPYSACVYATPSLGFFQPFDRFYGNPFERRILRAAISEEYKETY